MKPLRSAHRAGMCLLLCLGLTSCSRPAYLTAEEGPWLRFERTMCFGPCPAFVLEVDGLGHARFVGRAHVSPTGAHSAQWTETLRQRIAEVAHAVELKKHVGSYDNPMITDLPATRIQLAGHEVHDRINGPPITELYAVLDSAIQATDWLPVAE